MDHLCYLCLVFSILSRLFIAALWSPDWKWLTSWLLFVIFNCAFVTFPCCILGQVWYLIVWITDLCRLLTLLSVSFIGMFIPLSQAFHEKNMVPPPNHFTKSIPRVKRLYLLSFRFFSCSTERALN